VIRLRQLSKRYGDTQAVQALDLEIPTGQLLGLLGPNGAGKSTTVKMLTGIVLPSAGTAEVLGFDVVRDPVEVKRIVGYVPESGAVFGSLCRCSRSCRRPFVTTSRSPSPRRRAGNRSPTSCSE
jgi:ABC-2 type transport system ATP-binding protein